MTTLIANLSVGKGTWAQLIQLIDGYEWDKIFLVTNAFGKEKFSCNKPIELILIDPEKDIRTLAEEIFALLNGKIDGLDVAINMISGTGKEHMALLSAVLRLGVGIRQIVFTPEGMKEI